MKVVKILLVFIALTSCNKGEHEIIIATPGFTGRVLIIYDQPNGADPVYSNGKRVYRIPANGILKTKMSPNPGWIGTPEFYYQKISHDKMIWYESDPRKLPMDRVVAYGGSAGSTSEKNQIIRFLVYYVGSKTEIDSAYEKTSSLDIIKLLH
jgi:hypothetical protein